MYRGQGVSTKTSHEDDDLVRRRMLEKIIRVDHAGEMGASYIYQGNIFFWSYYCYDKVASSNVLESWQTVVCSL